MHEVPKWSDTMVNVSNHFGTLCIKGLQWLHFNSVKETNKLRNKINRLLSKGMSNY